MLVLVKCDSCGKEFEKDKRYIKDGRKNYCCKDCQNKGQLKGKICNCANCGKEVYKTLVALNKSKTGNVFCSKSCAASINNKLTKTGKNNSNFIDGASLYRDIAYSTYENECAICGFKEKSALIVHHIDEDRKNPDKDNLIILCANCHYMTHYGNLKIDEEIKSKRKLI